jgi:transaldolase/glucose-6-phosphate isomerase
MFQGSVAFKKEKELKSPYFSALRLSTADYEAVNQELKDWDQKNKTVRLWDRDSLLWTGRDESNWLGWLTVVDRQRERLEEFLNFQWEIRARRFKDAVVLGMGGSSLCPEVFSKSFAPVEGFPKVRILDSTDPVQVDQIRRDLDLKQTLFIVSSKSGSTLEPNLFLEYFWEHFWTLVREEEIDTEDVGRNFIAITDPGSQLEARAKSLGFWKVFYGESEIGGRYSAFSDFGMIPALVMGLDPERIIQETEDMVQACGASKSSDLNPGVILGVVLGALSLRGRDKVTLVISPQVNALGAWIAQLIAESTGKRGLGLIPIDREELGHPECYGRDRVFIHIKLSGEQNSEIESKIQSLAFDSQPIVQIEVPDSYALVQEFFRWEIATAVAGSILGINPFDQPDVEASKIATKKLTIEFERTHRLPTLDPLLVEGPLKFFSEGAFFEEMRLWKLEKGTECLHDFFNQLGSRDYFSLLAFLPQSEKIEKQLSQIQKLVRDSKKVATCVEFGPRYLHSTGQVYKGGSNSGVFLQITADSALDLLIPGHSLRFGVVQAAQAMGDFHVLAERGRRCLRIHLGRDLSVGLSYLRDLVQHSLQEGV